MICDSSIRFFFVCIICYYVRRWCLKSMRSFTLCFLSSSSFCFSCLLILVEFSPRHKQFLFTVLKKHQLLFFRLSLIFIKILRKTWIFTYLIWWYYTELSCFSNSCLKKNIICFRDSRLAFAMMFYKHTQMIPHCIK